MILVLCDDRWHPAQTPRTGLGALGIAGIDFLENANDWSAELMARYPVTILTKSNNVSSTDETPWMTDQVAAAFVDYVQQGNSLLVIHSGSAGYLEVPALRELLGGVFVQHPPQCPVTIEPLAEHPLTIGVEPFTLTDEHYFMTNDRHDLDIFLHSVSEHGAQPAGWRRNVGRGRVCMLTSGHNLEVWLAASYQQLIANALDWCRQSR